VRFAQNNATGISQNNYVVSSGAAFEIAGVSLQLNNGNVTLNGTGISSGGALRSISGNSILQGNNTIGTIVLASNSSIGVDADSTLTIKKVISGSGDLTKVGAGTLVLDGTLQGTGGAFDNTYTGATTVTAGTLEVRGSIASSSAITNDAALVFNSAAAQAYGNAIGGGGTFAKQGAGTLTLTGNNTYTGATTISSGILQIGAGGTTGTLGGGTNTSSDAFIADGAELRIERSTASSGYSYWGKLSGSGTVNLPAERRMNFRGNQPDSGTLAFQLDGILGVNTFEAATSVHLGGLSGAGTIQRSGNAGGAAILAIGGKGTSSTFGRRDHFGGTGRRESGRWHPHPRRRQHLHRYHHRLRRHLVGQRLARQLRGHCRFIGRYRRHRRAWWQPLVRRRFFPRSRQSQ
jgi:fibronectin-binding autotransporter adhesin